MTKKRATKKKKRSRKKKKKNDNSKLFYFFIGALLLLSGLIYLLDVRDEPTEHRPVVAKKIEKPKSRIKNKPVIREVPPAEIKPEPQGPRLAIIIDDIGYNRRYRDLIEMDVPITLAIIPFTPHSMDAAVSGGSGKAEIILHLPMEPKGYPDKNPGKGALLTEMTAEEILKQFRADLGDLPNIKGVNNHMGSSFTEFKAGMKVVLGDIKKRGLFFVDSKTSYKSVGYSLSREMNVKTAERSVFLDNDKSEKAIREQLMKAIEIAREKGEAIAIGHPYQTTVNVLLENAPTLQKHGIRLVVASEIVK